MSSITKSAKFKELLRHFNQEPREKNAKDDVPQSVRKSARDVKQPRRFDASPVPSSKNLKRDTPGSKLANRAKENVCPSPRQSRPKVGRLKPKLSSSRAPPSDPRKRDEPSRSKIDDFVDDRSPKPAANPQKDRSKWQERGLEPCDDSAEEDEPFDSASAPRTPPRSSAFRRVTSHNEAQCPSRGWSDSQFLRPPAPGDRESRPQNGLQNDFSTRRQVSRIEIPNARRDPHSSMNRQTETSSRRAFQPREETVRQPSQSREPSVRQSFIEPPFPSTFNPNRQPFVKLTDITQSRELTQRWEDGFLHPPTPPEVQDLVLTEKAKAQDSICQAIASPHLSALDVVYTINSIQDTIIAKMEKFCRKRERTESILRNTLCESMHDASRSGRDRIESWLDGVGPQGNHNSSRFATKRRPDFDLCNISKRPKHVSRYDCSRYDYY